MAHLKGIGILSDNLTGNRRDANVGGKYRKKTNQKMAKLASFGQKMSISNLLLDFWTSTLVYFTNISTISQSCHNNMLDTNAGRK